MSEIFPKYSWQNVTSVSRDQLVVNFLQRALEERVEGSDLGQLAVFRTALRSTAREMLGASLTGMLTDRRGPAHTLKLVETLCRRFPLLALQLTHRHSDRKTLLVKDEYDVQDLLHAILVLHFDDVRHEEWTPSYAGVSKRMDLMLKGEKVVIEVKKTRKGLDQKRVLDELAIDKMHYRAHPDCRALVCFVYDPEHRCHNAVALEQDASENFDGFRVVVVVSPHGT
jgi:hypothetical protein